MLRPPFIHLRVKRCVQVQGVECLTYSELAGSHMFVSLRRPKRGAFQHSQRSEGQPFALLFWLHSEACQWENVPCCLIQHATSESAPCRVSALCQPPMSFISTEPQSRVVLESHNNYLFAKFDTQLRIIADRYLSFFRERFINLLQVTHFPLTNHSSGVASKQPSQLLWKYQIAAILTDSLEVLILYGNSVARQKLLMPHSTLVLNQLRQGEHGTK